MGTRWAAGGGHPHDAAASPHPHIWRCRRLDGLEGERAGRSYRSAVNRPVNQLRDPAVFEEDGRTYLVYAVKGEAGLGIAELTI